MNTGRHVLKHPGALYAEGWAMSPDGFICQHAWATLGSGARTNSLESADQVIDRTWKEPELCLYFGVSIDVKSFAALMVDRPLWSLFADGSLADDVAAVVLSQLPKGGA